MDANELEIDALVNLYIMCRDWIKVENDKHSERIAVKKAVMNKIEGILQTFLDKTKQISGSCKTGSFYKRTKWSATIKDKKEFTRHVIGTEAWDLIDWKANVQAARDFEKENKTPLPGVTITGLEKVGVRRPGAKHDEDED